MVEWKTEGWQMVALTSSPQSALLFCGAWEEAKRLAPVDKTHYQVKKFDSFVKCSSVQNYTSLFPRNGHEKENPLPQSQQQQYYQSLIATVLEKCPLHKGIH